MQMQFEAFHNYRDRAGLQMVDTTNTSRLIRMGMVEFFHNHSICSRTEFYASVAPAAGLVSHNDSIDDITPLWTVEGTELLYSHFKSIWLSPPLADDELHSRCHT
jgi:hypothetical protein